MINKVLTLLGVCVLCTNTIYANVIYVNHAAIGLGTGNSWVNAFPDLQAAIDSAASGDEIWVAMGTYQPTSWPNLAGSTDLRERHFSLKNGVTVYGGFQGNETQLSQRDAQVYLTILSGDFNGDDADQNGDGFYESGMTENAYHVFYHPDTSGLDETAFLDGVTISGGNADGSNPHQRGAGMFNDEASPSIIGCTFTHNYASEGTVANISSLPLFVRCIFEFNIGYNTGVSYENSSSSIYSQSVFHKNIASGNPGVTAIRGDVIIENSTFTFNSSQWAEGVVENAFNNTLTLRHCTFSRNSGGAVRVTHATSSLIIDHSIIWENGAFEVDEGFSSGNTITDCIIKGGHATGVNINTDDPLLLALGIYGGDMPSMALGTGSPAINLGVAGVDTPAHDQRNILRDASPDIGAYEATAGSNYMSIEDITSGQFTYAIGQSPQLKITSIGNLTQYELFEGQSGDITNPILTQTASVITLPVLSANTSYWIRAQFDGTSLDSDTFTYLVTSARKYVSLSGDNINDGSSWSMAKRDLQDAIDESGYGAQVWVASGTYYPGASPYLPSSTDTRDRHFALKKGVSIYGGFLGSETTLAERNIQANSTIFSGDFNGDDIDSTGDGYLDQNRSENAYHIFYFSSYFEETAFIEINGCTIRSAQAEDNSLQGSGGGIYLNNIFDITVSESSFTQCYSLNGGSAIEVNYGSITLDNCTFHLNETKIDGAVRFSNVESTVSNCLFSGNRSIGLSESYPLSRGGALSMWYDRGSVISACTFLDNSSLGTFVSLETIGGAALFLRNRGTNDLLRVENCTFVSNTAALKAGAIALEQIENVLISHCTFYGNSAADGYGDAIFDNSLSSTAVSERPVIQNCIFWNHPSETVIVDNEITVADCIIDGSYTGGTNIINTDPSLLPLGNYGGLTQTMPLAAGSSAIDVGSTSSITPVTDQRGIPRDTLPDWGATESLIKSDLVGNSIGLGGAVVMTAMDGFGSPEYQWYEGASGDISQPISNQSILTLSSLGDSTQYWIRITDNGIIYDSATFTVLVRSTYSAWADYHTLIENDRDGAANPAGDGIPNLIKYALGLNPNATETRPWQYDINKETGKFTFEVNLWKVPTDLTITFQASDDLVDWDVLEPTSSMIDEDLHAELWQSEISYSDTAIFQRIQVNE